MDMFQQMLEDEYKALDNELKQVGGQCKKDGKSCKNCGCIRYSGSNCIDMTCWRGYVDGDHDGWVQGGKNSPNAKFHQKNPNMADAEDYKYQPFKLTTFRAKSDRPNIAAGPTKGEN